MNISTLLDCVYETMPAVCENIADRSGDVCVVTDDSNRVCSGAIFVCVKGERFDGHDFAAEALSKGALLVVTERDLGLSPQIVVENSRLFYGHLCAAFHGNPERKLKLIGITGTNGKTTVAEMIRSVLDYNGSKVGFIGTTGATINGEPIESDDSTPTTPRVSELYDMFDKMLKAGCEYVVMEVSSFALSQNRIGPAIFKAAVFTNLTQDHLDYHKTMEDYYQAKKLLFTEHSEAAFICSEGDTVNEYGIRLKEELAALRPNMPCFSYGLDNRADILASNIKAGAKTTFWLTLNNKSYPVSINMIGDYNVLNAIATLSVCSYVGVSVDKAILAMENFAGVIGRCEILYKKRGFTVIRDYAHSPDGIEKILTGVREYFDGRIICLFGCGGERDKKKRPIMGETAEKYSDYMIITSDNPRTEDPDLIIDDIIDGLNGTTPYIREADRKRAIMRAITMAKPGDVVLLLGKGHETYQVLGNNKISFDERIIVSKITKNYKANLFDGSLKESMTIDEIARAVGGDLSGCSDIADKKIAARDIFSDTRKPIKDGLFIAIKGDNFDGHDFSASAVKGGAAAAVTDHAVEGLPCIVVKDTRAALLKLAAYFREKFSPIVIGITGSVGKTTTKEMTAVALSGGRSVFRSGKNFNNEIGLPFQVFKLNRSVTAAVLEMGMSNLGEIERLSKTGCPDICVVTNIGWSHIENLGSRKNILKAKLEILAGAKKHAPLILNGDDKLLSEIINNYPERRVITYGIDFKRADYKAVDIEYYTDRSIFKIVKGGREIAEVVLYCFGRHNILNALCAVTVAAESGCDPAFAASLLSGYSVSDMRQEIKVSNGHTLILDCYNASPDSMKAAIDVLTEMPVKQGGRRIAVLGDMLELGEFSKTLHEQIGEYISTKNIDILFCYGQNSKYIAWTANIESKIKSIYSSDKTYISDYLRSMAKPGDIILFKASRGMKLEEIALDFQIDN